ncbi:hypothetical protein MUK42_34504 [Musa troglodytarum]|uniref:Uncharacterized protein n=1 Tax=Musa troglodytarum TaxID=320322 RepID=A0A9E7FIG4_9LILI|nr:hypothetical protein MUK42_34504 [Musa troglodytarum]
MPTLSPSVSPSCNARWFRMAIQEKLMQAVVEHRAQLALVAALAAAVVSLLSVGPSFSAVAGFFWPLLVSTAFLLVAVAVLLRISPPPGETSGEELIDYVAGRPEDAQLAGPYEETPGEGEAEAEAEAERAKHQKWRLRMGEAVGPANEEGHREERTRCVGEVENKLASCLLLCTLFMFMPSDHL